MFQGPERTPWPASTSSIDLRCIGILPEQIDDFGIGDRVERRLSVDKSEVLERVRVEECIGEVIVRRAILGVRGRRPFLLVIVVS